MEKKVCEKPIDLFNVFEFVDTSGAGNTGKTRIPENVCVIHYREAYKCVNFSALLNKKFIERGIKSCRLALNTITNEMALVFGTNVTDPHWHPVLSKNKQKECSTGCVSSTSLVMSIARHFDIPLGESKRLVLSEDRSVRPDVMFFTLSAE